MSRIIILNNLEDYEEYFKCILRLKESTLMSVQEQLNYIFPIIIKLNNNE